MDSSNAEKASPWDRPDGCFGHCDPEGWFAPCRDGGDKMPSKIRGVLAWRQNYARDALTPEVFDRWLASRDAEVSELTHLLAESRARFGDSEARRAELEAVVQAVREWVDTTGYHRAKDLLPDLEVPSVVLEDRDRENRAIGWDEGERHESEYLSEWGQFCPGEHCNPYRGDANA